MFRSGQLLFPLIGKLLIVGLAIKLFVIDDVNTKGVDDDDNDDVVVVVVDEEEEEEEDDDV